MKINSCRFSDKEEQNGIALLKLPFMVPNKHWILRPCGYKTQHKDHKLGIVGTGATKEGSVVMPPFVKTMRVFYICFIQFSLCFQFLKYDLLKQ